MVFLAGIEVEYAVIVEGAGRQSIDPYMMSRRVVTSHRTALSQVGICSYGTPADGMLSNGARLYDDLGHPEYATPECREITTLVACDRVGERLLKACCDAVAPDLPSGWELTLYKNNTDHAGRTWGCHENYLVSPSLFERLTVDRGRDLSCGLVPFLVTRQLIGGAGRVGGEGGWSGYQLSQRADFIRTVVGPETMRERPIVNTRDEALADRSRFCRLHLVVGDANMSEFATFLKVGATWLVLRLLEDRALIGDLALADPVMAMHAVSRNPTGPLPLVDGRRYTALEIQMSYLEQVETYLEQAGTGLEEQRILAEWTNVLETLRTDPMALSDRLDWAIKLLFLENIRSEEGIGWDAPLLKELDLRYHDIAPERSIFYALETKGLVRRLLTDDSQVAHYSTAPPVNTRAHLRTDCLRACAGDLIQVNWHYLTSQGGLVEWPDPTRF